MNRPMTGDFPHYSYPSGMVAGLAFDFLFKHAHSFREDGLACIGRLKPGLQILGTEAIPQSGPCLLTFNHYYRPGFNAWWMSLALAATIPVEIHFVMTGELTFPGKWYAPLGMAGSHWLLQRFAGIYGFTSMPPMPPRPKDVNARARSVRRVLAFARSHPKAMLGLAPEGGDQPGGLLTMPPAGAGRFILLLVEQGFPILPVGCFEEAGTFCLHFGEMYHLKIPDKLMSKEKDVAAARSVMQKIAPLLPERLRGEFT
jgi:1-acyl-sn-glycerol-3-phosphate acyltransferase